MENESTRKVIAFIAKKAGVNKSKISLESRLGSDLGLDGDDALELLEGFGEEFNVSIENIDFEKYFNEEYDIWGIQNLFNRLFRKDKFIDKRNNEIFVSQLVESLESGRLILS